jgi:XTP/dITP diphosphohydrolase
MKKIKKIIIGTHNKGKFKELSYLLPKNLKKMSPINLSIESPAETGKTFIANSELKARYFYKKTKIVSLSDDSGLSIKCLGGKPGIHSARFAKKHGSFKNAMKMIINKIKNKKIKKAEAEFICSLSICLEKKRTITAVGKVEGYISEKIKGKNGFGYDPIFIPRKYKKTFAEFSKRKKMLMDHRFVAYKKLIKKTNIL